MSTKRQNSTQTPLCVDLDGTLVKTDVLVEAYLNLIKQHPLTIGKTLLWLAKGKAYLKQQICSQSSLDVTTLPYNKEFIKWLKQEKKQGRTLHLATASDEHLAKPIAKHIGLFDRVIASDGISNISGSNKAHVLLRTFGEKKFSYAGNAPVDMHVWKHADERIVVNALPSVIRKVKKQYKNTVKTFGELRIFHVPTILKSIRVHQWVKNTLLFVPILTAHQLTNIPLLLNTALAFIAFSFTASSIYLANDLMDLESDRKHRTKKHRPLASGTMHVLTAMATILILLALSATLSFIFLTTQFLLILGTYICINIVYTFWLKRVVIIDVVVLTGLYVLRILAGGAATAIPTSGWLLLFAAFFFASLALVKRVSELVNMEDEKAPNGRGYRKTDQQLLTVLGIISGYVSVAVLGFYITSETVVTLYATPIILWLLLPIFAFWFSHVWRLTVNGDVNEDPTVFAAKDMTSYLAAAASVILIILAQ